MKKEFVVAVVVLAALSWPSQPEPEQSQKYPSELSQSSQQIEPSWPRC